MALQRIVTVIDTGDKPKYELNELKEQGGDYEALRRFFEDIGIEVVRLDIEDDK